MAISVTVHPLQGQTLAISPAGLDLLTTLSCHRKNVLDFLSSSKMSETSNTFQIWDHRPLPQSCTLIPRVFNGREPSLEGGHRGKGKAITEAAHDS